MSLLMLSCHTLGARTKYSSKISPKENTIMTQIKSRVAVDKHCRTILIMSRSIHFVSTKEVAQSFRKLSTLCSIGIVRPEFVMLT
jgi:hypothetical protein